MWNTFTRFIFVDGNIMVCSKSYLKIKFYLLFYSTLENKIHIDLWDLSLTLQVY